MIKLGVVMSFCVVFKIFTISFYSFKGPAQKRVRFMVNVSFINKKRGKITKFKI
jgi:hypothetical protein